MRKSLENLQKLTKLAYESNSMPSDYIDQLENEIVFDLISFDLLDNAFKWDDKAGTLDAFIDYARQIFKFNRDSNNEAK